MADIFISYSQKDRAQVKQLVDALTAEGYEVWWDLEIRAGESFDQLIEDTLKQVRCVVAVWSRQSVKSEWVRAESAWAKDRNRLVSIRIDEDLELPLKFYHVHTKSMAGWKGARDDPVFRKLVADIRQLAGPPSLPASALKSGSRAAAEQWTEPAPVPVVAPEPTSLPPSSAKPAARAASQPSPEPGPASTKPVPRSGRGRRGVIVGTISLVAAALAGGLFFVGTTEKPPTDGEPPASIAEPGQDVPAPGSKPVAIPDQGQRRPVQPSEFRDTLEDGSEEPEMVVIPAGEFRMGCVSGKGCNDDELPVRTVTFGKPFAIGKYEVTFAEYDRFAEATGAGKPDDRGWGTGDRPVINVSWDDAVAYAAWLSDQTGKRYRLPSEAEREYAARAGTETPFWTGICIHTDQANYNGNYDYGDCGAKTGVYREQTVPAGSLPANPWKLHEVHGNVWEWVQDCWHDSYQGAPVNGSAWLESGGGSCGRRVVRGGSWNNEPRYLRSALRSRNNTDNRDNNLGFRLAQDL